MCSVRYIVNTSDEARTITTPRGTHRGQSAEMLAHIEKVIVDGLRHGFFDCSITCKLVSGRKREVVIGVSKSHKFTIPEEEVPR